MNRLLQASALLLILTRCNTPSFIQSAVPIYPTHPLVLDSTDRVIVGTVYDVERETYRENKKRVFKDQMNKAIDDIAYVFSFNSPAQITTIHDYIYSGYSPDDAVRNQLEKDQADYAVMIQYYDAWFDQTGTEENERGRTTGATYDIIVDMKYQFWNRGEIEFDTVIRVRKFHSDRIVLIPWLAFGPNIVEQEGPARETTQLNVDLYMRSFFEIIEDRGRAFYIKKDFKKVGNAFNAGDYNLAFAESEKLILSKDEKVRAKAYYDCAVLLELREDYVNARIYVEEALKHYRLKWAENMLYDYRHQPR